VTRVIEERREPDAVDGDQEARPRARALAFYLPQFHTTPENDRWWGEGFTEWTNVRAARPLFRGHAQPVVPGELGYYDLASAEVRQAQADLASSHGVEAFAYWHYWFGGKRLLERPFDAVRRMGEPKLPFCLAWANHSWTASWVGRPYEMLMEQTYPGLEDHLAHYRYLREAFADDRYVTVDGKPLFIIFRPKGIPDCRRFTDLLRESAIRDGFRGVYVLGIMDRLLDPRVFGLDGSIDPGIGQLVSHLPRRTWMKSELRRRARIFIERPRMAGLHQALGRAPRLRFLGSMGDEWSRRALLPLVHDYADVVARACETSSLFEDRYPTAVPNWDNTPRLGRWGMVLSDSTPEVYARHLRHAVDLVQERPRERRLVFLKSWNEWAEGNYLEPDARFGRAYLEATRDVLTSTETTRATRAATR